MALLNPALRGFYETPGIRNYVLHGGRASSKTYHTAGICVYLASNYRVNFLCTRQFQNRISDSVKTVIEECINVEGIADQFRITDTEIEHRTTGSKFRFLGIQRNLAEIKGIANIDILWVEEAEDLTAEQWSILTPTVRAENSRIFIVFNPRLASDFVYKKFVVDPPADTIVRQINYNENPYLSGTMRKLIADAKVQDFAEYEHIYLGVPRSDDDESVIKRSWLMAAIDAHKVLGIDPAGSRRIGFDVADSGADKCAMIAAHGPLAYWSDEWKAEEDELLKSCTKVWTAARERNSEIIYDAIGVGAASGAKFNELNAPHVRTGGTVVAHDKFFAGGAVVRPDSFYGLTRIKNKDFFANIKAQVWWGVADRLKNTYNAVKNGQQFDVDEMIFIDSAMPNLHKLIDELSTPKRDFDLAGRTKVESKKDLAKRDVPSPNCFIEGTLISTPFGDTPIELLKVGDDVYTPMGVSQIIFVHENIVDEIVSNRGLTGTPEHPIFTWDKGWVPLRMLTLCEKIETFKGGFIKWQMLNLLHTKAKCSQFSTRVDITVQGGMAERMLEMSDFYIEGFGLSIMGKFLMACTSIMSMVIGETMTLKILNALIGLNINARICSNALKTQFIEMTTLLSWHLSMRVQKHGILRKMGGNGILKMAKRLLQKEKQNDVSASYAKKSFHPNSCLTPMEFLKPALSNAGLLFNTSEQKQLASQHAKIAGQYSYIQNLEKTSQLEDVVTHAHGQLNEIKVYNLTLKEHNAYYANGILVRNCADAFIMCFLDGVIKKPMRISTEMLRKTT